MEITGFLSPEQNNQQEPLEWQWGLDVSHGCINYLWGVFAWMTPRAKMMSTSQFPHLAKSEMRFWNKWRQKKLRKLKLSSY
ncbi:hypothetical protein GIB67_020111 [Kingdonia uniflora]|uniref:Uncharacterized protein n=1 Tax=Kingdonia uniflora TaxID=39325 RepID=A0A7J7NJD8_9MAGN|nr:hypothetical protein GIB67_029758 [Kingdonia uniflora]KAF6176807.1 hypothetical protein GIB67_020111 [Kingdonia uniflora]